MKKFNEVSPPGWGHTKAEKEKTKPNKPKSKIGGTAHEFDKDLKSGKFKGLPGDKTMKDKKASMFKLMWSMKNKGDKHHYKPGVKNKLKAKYKEKNEMIDAKKIRNYKNVSNATVEKANKEAQKVKDKEQNATLQFPEMPQTEGWGAVAKAADSSVAKSKAKEVAAKNKKVSSWMKSRKEDMSLAPKGKGKKAAQALYKEDDVDESVWVGPKPNTKPGRKKTPYKAPNLKQGMKTGPTAKVATKRGAMRVGSQTGSGSTGAAAPTLSMDMSLAPKGKGRKAAMKGEEVFVERILELDYKEFGFETQKDLIEYATDYFKEGSLNPAQRKAREASRSHSTLGKGRRLHGGRGADHPKGAMGSGRGKFTYDRPAGTKRKPGREKIVATPVKK